MARIGALSLLCAAAPIRLQAEETGVLMLELPLTADMAKEYREFTRQGVMRTQALRISITDDTYKVQIIGKTEEVTVSPGKSGLMVRTAPFLAKPGASMAFSDRMTLSVTYSDYWTDPKNGAITMITAGELANMPLTKAERATFAEAFQTKGVLLFATDVSEPRPGQKRPLGYKPLGINVEGFKAPEAGKHDSKGKPDPSIETKSAR